MHKISKRISILAVTLVVSLPFLYAQESGQEPEKPVMEKQEKTEELTEVTPIPEQNKEPNPFLKFINSKAYASRISEDQERKILRRKWKELLRIDVFYPYFKAREVEEWIRDKAKMEVFDLKGRPKFENNQIKYIFKKRF